ncbi:hypothetical protein BDW59DRAFT_163575 [Aspergillus cavernicola]|uniref:Ankyrin repeat-containing domain protein n=1 Tax=Aspergillus cavernicola TaxID=176166 RepID=A0ABR4I6Z6_9EURO
MTDTILEAAAGNTKYGDDMVGLLLEHRDQSGYITEDVLMAVAGNEDLGHQIITLLFKGPSDIRVTPAVLQVAAENLHQGAKIMALLLSKNPGNIQITEEIIISAVHNDVSGLEILTLLGKHNHDELEVTESVMLAAAGSENFMEVINLFLGLHKGNLPITNTILVTTARNPVSTQEDQVRLLELSNSKVQVTEECFDTRVHMHAKATFLLRNQGRITEHVMVAAAGREDYDSESSFQGLLAEPHDPVTDVILGAAAGKSLHGPDFVDFILACYAKDLHILETTLLAATRNPKGGPEVLALLLEQRPDVQITNDVILAAAGTDTNALEVLIRHINDSPTKSPIQMTEGLLEAIAGNRSCGARAFRLLFDTQVEDKSRLPFTQKALINAAANVQCGYEVMTLLLDHGGFEDLVTLITENVIIAAAGNLLWGLDILALLLDHDYVVDWSMNVFAAAEKNIWSGEEIIAFLLRYQGIQNKDEDADLSEDYDQAFNRDGDVDLSEYENWSDDNTEVPEALSENSKLV